MTTGQAPAEPEPFADITDLEILNLLEQYRDLGVLRYVLPTIPLGEEWVIGVGEPGDGLVKLRGGDMAAAFLAGAGMVAAWASSRYHTRKILGMADKILWSPGAALFTPPAWAHYWLDGPWKPTGVIHTLDREPPAEVAGLGHQLEWDPPAALTSMRRWTCLVCGDAVLARPDGTVYGAASEHPCNPEEHL
jgi:hypothetical protein